MLKVCRYVNDLEPMYVYEEHPGDCHDVLNTWAMKH